MMKTALLLLPLGLLLSLAGCGATNTSPNGPGKPQLAAASQIHVDAEGKYIVAGKSHSREALKSLLMREKKNLQTEFRRRYEHRKQVGSLPTILDEGESSAVVLTFTVDDDARYADLNAAMETCAECGFERFVLKVDQKAFSFRYLQWLGRNSSIVDPPESITVNLLSDVQGSLAEIKIGGVLVDSLDSLQANIVQIYPHATLADRHVVLLCPDELRFKSIADVYRALSESTSADDKSIALVKDISLSPVIEEMFEELQLELEVETELDKPGGSVGLDGPVEPAPDELALQPGDIEVVSIDTAEVAPEKAARDDHLVSADAAEVSAEADSGNKHLVVDDYGEALDLITRDILRMLEKSPVTVVWCFDQSESMKDDQAEIRARVKRLYEELALAKHADDAVMTEVTSYGAGYRRETREPTNDLTKIRQAISQIPVDPSGKEMMCEAVGRSIHDLRVRAKGRQMMLVLVTDESGDRENNERFLEQAIAEAKLAKCKVYVLGREAVFGYPYAHLRWQHPQTKRFHWLRIDRGPESAFIETLQTNGFWQRQDALASGFGPFEQCRLARETGGTFFMLPSVEMNLADRRKDKPRLQAMQRYQPDLRSRSEQLKDREQKPLRAALWQVAAVDLNPYDPAAAKFIVLRQSYSLDADDFKRQADAEREKATAYVTYLARIQSFMDKNAKLRQEEMHPRWQANWDLMHAQVVAFQARAYEYARYLDHFAENPETAPATKAPNLKLVAWKITTRRQTLAEDKKIASYEDRDNVLDLIQRADKLFDAVERNHPGTPWAERAKWEKSRGYGVHLVPDYDVIFRAGGGVAPIPIPKF